jgi:RimJ/RimL family protein N-acetyltransferase
MAEARGDRTIRTPRLELVALSDEFVDAVVAGDVARAERQIGARVGRWLVADPGHIIQLHLAERATERERLTGIGRAIVLSIPGRARRVVGSIGFHGPPDDQGRMELGCRIGVAHRGMGYSAEAMTALTRWAADRFAVTRFVVAVPSPAEAPHLVPIKMWERESGEPHEWVDGVASVLEREPT